MIAVAEEQLAVSADGGRRLSVWTHDVDHLRQEILLRRGYVKRPWGEHERRQRLTGVLPEAKPVPGYTVRSLGDEGELPARSWLSWQAFHPDEPDDRYEGWEWYRNIQRMPLYRRDLDLVVVSDAGELVSFCTVWYDDMARYGQLEPVGTAPAHRRRGLGRAVLAEAVRRLANMGATMAAVTGGSVPANGLYATAGFTEYDEAHPWRKEW
jgi:ribosomal protein S18 acetylase RimI-like enzyme